MGGRFAGGKLVFDICMQGGAYMCTFLHLCVHVEVSRQHAQDDCNLLGRFQS